MGMTVELPPALGDELTRDAEREDVSPSEHASLLLSLATALLSARRETPFRRALKEFLVTRFLEPDAMESVFEELFAICLRRHLDPLSVDFDADLIIRDLPPPESVVQAAGRLHREPSARGKCSRVAISSEDVAREHQEDIVREERGWE